jgi:hypothetical protein
MPAQIQGIVFIAVIVARPVAVHRLYEIEQETDR